MGVSGRMIPGIERKLSWGAFHTSKKVSAGGRFHSSCESSERYVGHIQRVRSVAPDTPWLVGIHFGRNWRSQRFGILGYSLESDFGTRRGSRAGRDFGAESHAAEVEGCDMEAPAMGHCDVETTRVAVADFDEERTAVPGEDCDVERSEAPMADYDVGRSEAPVADCDVGKSEAAVGVCDLETWTSRDPLHCHFFRETVPLSPKIVVLGTFSKCLEKFS
ncbi:hypothetical protein AXG93_2318s1420 [Marchantia polymorpha subsp. ruderalis]|uniref:Uncharacterized protein n=1 Tax=Marchantia polymorpha subsp. ruderalis TaxID=1480154 RepID=A0A176VQZ4_MARPO|nr:hypothetical protein AXG93_2318s1420 [Marchantia polymorpha subsp. ruderalis]